MFHNIGHKTTLQWIGTNTKEEKKPDRFEYINALVRNQVKAMLIGRKKEYYYFFMREYFIIPCIDIYNIVSKKKYN